MRGLLLPTPPGAAAGPPGSPTPGPDPSFLGGGHQGPGASPPPPQDAVPPAGVWAAPNSPPCGTASQPFTSMAATVHRTVGAGMGASRSRALAPFNLRHIDGHSTPALPAGQSLGGLRRAVVSTPNWGFRLRSARWRHRPARPPALRFGSGGPALQRPPPLECVFRAFSPRSPAQAREGRGGFLGQSLTPEPFGLNSGCRRWGRVCQVDSRGPGNTLGLGGCSLEARPVGRHLGAPLAEKAEA